MIFSFPKVKRFDLRLFKLLFFLPRESLLGSGGLGLEVSRSSGGRASVSPNDMSDIRPDILEMIKVMQDPEAICAQRAQTVLAPLS